MILFRTLSDPSGSAFHKNLHNYSFFMLSYTQHFSHAYVEVLNVKRRFKFYFSLNIKSASNNVTLEVLLYST